MYFYVGRDFDELAEVFAAHGFCIGTICPYRSLVHVPHLRTAKGLLGKKGIAVDDYDDPLQESNGTPQFPLAARQSKHCKLRHRRKYSSRRVVTNMKRKGRWL